MPIRDETHSVDSVNGLYPDLSFAELIPMMTQFFTGSFPYLSMEMFEALNRVLPMNRPFSVSP